MILADGGQVDKVRDATDGRGANVVLDFVGDGTTPRDGLAMLARGGYYVTVGYGGRLERATRPISSSVSSPIMGSLIGTIKELEELVAVAARKRSASRPDGTHSTTSTRRWSTCGRARSEVGPLIVP